jgi:hypothetical protein
LYFGEYSFIKISVLHRNKTPVTMITATIHTWIHVESILVDIPLLSYKFFKEIK